jgi:hypothetical protein
LLPFSLLISFFHYFIFDAYFDFDIAFFTLFRHFRRDAIAVLLIRCCRQFHISDDALRRLPRHAACLLSCQIISLLLFAFVIELFFVAMRLILLHY